MGKGLDQNRDDLVGAGSAPRVNMSQLMASIRYLRVFLLAAGIACVASAHIHGQQPAEVTAETPPQDAAASVDVVPPEQVAIPIADIPAAGDEVTANVRRVAALAEPDAGVEAVEAAMAEQAGDLVVLRADLNGMDPGRTSIERIEDQRVKWAELDRTLDGWMSVLQARWTLLQSERSELREAQRLWALTRDNPVGEEASKVGDSSRPRRASAS